MKLIPTSNPSRGFGIVTVILLALLAESQLIAATAEHTAVPKLWDEEALASMTLPAAIPGTRILYVSADTTITASL